MLESYDPQLVLNRMIDLFGESGLVNPDHYPKVFKHQIFLAKWMLYLDAVKQQEKSSLDPEPEV